MLRNAFDVEKPPVGFHRGTENFQEKRTGRVVVVVETCPRNSVCWPDAATSRTQDDVDSCAASLRH